MIFDAGGRPMGMSEQAMREEHARQMQRIQEHADRQREWFEQRERLWGPRR